MSKDEMSTKHRRQRSLSWHSTGSSSWISRSFAAFYSDAFQRPGIFFGVGIIMMEPWWERIGNCRRLVFVCESEKDGDLRRNSHGDCGLVLAHVFGSEPEWKGSMRLPAGFF